MDKLLELMQKITVMRAVIESYDQRGIVAAHLTEEVRELYDEFEVAKNDYAKLLREKLKNV